MPLTWPSKDPNEVLDYTVDWTDRLAGDTIATATFSLTTANGVEIESSTNTTTAATVWLSGGDAGGAASINCRVVTAAGRTMDQTIVLAIWNR